MAQNTESTNVPYKTLQEEGGPIGPPPSYPQAPPYPQPYPEGQTYPTGGSPPQASQPQIVNVSMDNTVFGSRAGSFLTILAITDVSLKKVKTESIKVGNHEIKPAESVRNIGAMFDKRMKVKAHVQRCLA